MKTHQLWAGVAIIGILVAGAVTLTLAGKDVSVIRDLAILIALPLLGLGAVGGGVAIYQKQQQIEKATNGNTASLMHALTKSHEQNVQLALKVPTVDETTIPRQPVGVSSDEDQSSSASAGA